MSNAVCTARLENGLEVILREVHSAPVTSTWMWYRVGSRNEVEGHTGLSHWVEHMMFKGSSQFPKGSIMREVDRCGGYINAMTSHDFTAYYITLPSDRAELALRIMADQMGSALFDAREVEAERTVIIAEREESENDPYYLLAEEVAAAAFRVHPYHHQTIGWKTDLKRITRDELYTHYRQYYAPDNAVLVVVGDFAADAGLDAVRRLFAPIPPAAQPPRVAPEEPPQLGERRVVVHMPGSAPTVRICYHTPPASHADYLPLVLLDGVLSGGKAVFAFGESPTRSARLYRALVETQLASSAGSHYPPSLDPYLLTLGATVREGREPEAVEHALLTEMERLCEERVTDHELAVAIRQTQAQFAYASESASSQALTLGYLEIVDDHWRMEHLLEDLARVTPEDVQRVARSYLGGDNRVTGWFLPSSSGGASQGDGAEARGWRLPDPGTLAFYAASRSMPVSPGTVVRQELDNGAVLLAKENATSPSVTIAGYLKAGSLHETDERAGLAYLTASMLRRGTRKRTFQEINVALDDVGASLHFSADTDAVEFGGHGLASDYTLLTDLLSEILMEPTFPEVEWEKLRGQILTQLGVLDTDTSYRADREFEAALYPVGHPFARPVMGTRETVSALGVRQLLAFHGAYYRPAVLTIAVVGAVEPERAIGELAARLGRWPAGQAARQGAIPWVETPQGIVTRRVELPAKAQVELVWGVVGLERISPQYYAAMMANLILGRLGLMGRLGANLRDDQGLAYYVSSALDAGHGPQPWSIMAGVHSSNIERTVASILDEVVRLREEPVRDEELADGKSYLTGVLPLRLETNEGIAQVLLDIEDYDLGLDYLQRYPGIIEVISSQEVQRAARDYLTPDRYVLAMAGTFAPS